MILAACQLSLLERTFQQDLSFVVPNRRPSVVPGRPIAMNYFQNHQRFLGGPQLRQHRKGEASAGAFHAKPFFPWT